MKTSWTIFVPIAMAGVLDLMSLWLFFHDHNSTAAIYALLWAISIDVRNARKGE